MLYNMLMLHARRDEHGFTLLELLIAIGVFAVVITALTAGVQNLMSINNRSRDLALTNLIAESKAEQIRSAGFNSLSVGTVDFTAELPPELAAPKSATYTISNPSAGILEAVITITYQDYGEPRTQTYKTIISELGVGQ